MDGLCALCDQHATLRRSHIVPEFAYKPAYDESHRLVVVNPGTSEQRGHAPKGLRSHLLCDDCEQLLNDRYEKPFRRYWLDGEVPAPSRRHMSPIAGPSDVLHAQSAVVGV